MLVEEGKKAIAHLIANEFTIMQLGDGGDDTSPKQTALDSAITDKITCNSVVVTNKQIYFNCTMLGSQINATNVNELGIFSTSTYAGNASHKDKIDNKLLARINFNSIGPFAANDTVNLTLVMEVV